MDLRKEMREHKVRTLKTFILSLLFVGLGIYGATPGVTLVDLKILTNTTTIGEIANILPTRAGGYAFGALISGIIPNFVDHQICLMVSLVISIATFAALPYFQSIKIMFGIIFLAGMSAGCIDTVGNVYTIFLWRKKAAPFIQFVHFAFGLGAFISPMIANPFLLKVTEEIEEFGHDISKGYGSFKNQTEQGVSSFGNSTNDHFQSKPTAADVKIHWAYIIISIFNLCVLIFFLIVYCLRPKTPEYPTNSSSESTPEKEKKKLAEKEKSLNGNSQLIISDNNNKSDQLEKSMNGLLVISANLAEKEKSLNGSAFVRNDKSDQLEKADKFHHSESGPFDEFNLKKPLSPFMKLVVLALSVLFFHLYCGLEISFGSLLSAFAVKSKLKMSTSEGAFITSVYWGMFTFFRILSLFGIAYFSPRAMLIFNMALIMLSNAFLLPLANQFRWALWIGSALMGLGCSSVFATMFAFVEQLTPVTTSFTSITMIACCLGEFIIPLLVGAWIDSNPEVYLYVIFVYSLLSLIVLLILFWIQHKLLKKQNAEK